MAFKNKKELLEGIQKIIYESLGKSKDIDSLRDSLISLAKQSVVELMEADVDKDFYDVLQQYYQIFENYDENRVEAFGAFVKAVSEYSTGNPEVNKVVEKLQKAFNDNSDNIQILSLLDGFSSSDMRWTVEEAFNKFMSLDDVELDQDALAQLEHALKMAEKSGEPNASKILQLLHPEKMLNHAYEPAKIDVLPSDSDAQYEQYFKKEHDPKSEITEEVLKSIQEKVENYIDSKLGEKETEKFSLNDIANQNGILLKESIVKMKSSASNKKLSSILEQYEQALNNGAFEERLYETFISNVSKFDYLQPVDTELSALKQRISKAKEDIDLTKILETMLETTSYYLVPLIEDDVVKYMKDKNQANRTMLKTRLSAFGGDPYIDEMLRILYLDDSKKGIVESAVITNEDTLKFISEQAHVEDLFSPVLFVRENEALFNVDGSFYKKKGNQILRLDQDEIGQLDESFIELCSLINNPMVTVNEDCITLKDYSLEAKIFENHAEINGINESQSSLRDLNMMSMRYEAYNPNFFIMASCLLENFDKIAKIDFAKRVALNESEDLSVDLFKIQSNIFIVANNKPLQQSTFYRNVNPIQCAHIINEHMGMKVSSLFENLLPAQDKIFSRINESKEKYESKIEQLEEMIEKLGETEEVAEGKDADKVKKAKEECQTKLEALKKEYKDWQKKAKDFVEGSEDQKDFKDNAEKLLNDEDDDSDGFDVAKSGKDIKIIQKDDEPMSKKETEENRDELEEPLSDETPDNGYDDEIDDSSAMMSKFNIDDEISMKSAEDSEEDDSDIKEDNFIQDDNLLRKFSDEHSDEMQDENEAEEEPSYKIVDVLFDKDINGELKSTTGTVTVICKMVSPDGKISNNTNEINFFVDDDLRVNIDTSDYISTDLYNAMLDAIKQSADFSKIEDDATRDPADELDNPRDISFESKDESEETIRQKPKKQPGAILDIRGEISEEPKNDPVMTYSEDGTDFELPSPQADGSAIPESYSYESSKKNHKKMSPFLEISSIVKSDKGTFRVNESGITAVEDEDLLVEDPNVADEEQAESRTRLEEEDEKISSEDYKAVIYEVYDQAKKSSQDLKAIEDDLISETLGASSISVYNDGNEKVDGIIFLIDDNSREFYSIELEDYLRDAGSILEQNSLSMEQAKEMFQVEECSMDDFECCANLITTGFAALTGQEISITLVGEDINENLKIRKKKGISTDFDDADSVFIDEVTNGSKQEKDNEKEIEIAKEKNEGFKPKLPNFHVNVNESVSKEIHPMDVVMFNNEKAVVQSCKGDACVILQNGITIEVKKSQLRKFGEADLNVPDQFKFDKNNLTTDLDTAPAGKLRDLNKDKVKCNIVMDGCRLNLGECYAAFADLSDSKKSQVKVVNESGDEEVYDKENVEILPVPSDEWPYAVLVSGEDDEPSRKILVDPKSYLEASDSEMVNCIVAGKLSRIPKSKIRILS